MNRIFEKEYDLRSNDFDMFNHIRPASVLELFQDVAGKHAEKIGVGYDDMMARSYFWVLVKIKFQIISQPSLNQRVIIKTWPLAPNKFMYRREYSIESETGEKLIAGSSEWVVLDVEKRRLVSAPDLYSFSDGFHTEFNFEEKLGKVENFESDAIPYSITPGFSEIDVNNHVNNTKYTNFVFDAINPEESFEIDTFQIDYRKEVLRGTKLDIYHKEFDNTILAKGQDGDGNVMFACKVEYRK